MKRDLTIVIISGIITVTTLILSLFVNVGFALVTLVSFVVFFGYLLGFLKENFRRKYDDEPYQQIAFPAKYLAYANTALLFITIGLFIMDFTTADASFRGLLSIIVAVFVLPLIIGMYIVIFCIYKMKNKN